MSVLISCHASKQVLSNKEASPYISGIALHWYKDSGSSTNILDRIHQAFPDKFLFATEACEGSFSQQTEKVDLGSWDRAASYATDIISVRHDLMLNKMFLKVAHLKHILRGGMIRR